MTVRVGSVELTNPVMTASGTAGYGTELARYLDLSALGAVVVKSLAAYEWAGNPAPRLHPTPKGMLNAVGLQGPGLPYWLDHVLPDLVATGATVVASIWGRSVDDYARAADLLATAPPEIVAVEINLSCPNLESRDAIFAHDPDLSAEVLAATAGCVRPRWAKLSANTDRIVEVAGAVAAAGAEAVTCINTLLGLAYDPVTRRPALGAGGGGLSGPAIHPVAVRAVHDVHGAHPDLPIVGVGGVTTGWDAAELLLAGAVAVQVGTATFADPRAPARVLAELREGDLESPVAEAPSTHRGRLSGTVTCMATPPQLTPEQRTAALAKAAEARAARAEIKARLKDNRMTLAEALDSDDPNVGKLKVLSLLESLPRWGKVKARKVMEDIGIADNRRVQGLGTQQRQALLEARAASGE